MKSYHGRENKSNNKVLTINTGQQILHPIEKSNLSLVTWAIRK